MQSETILFTHEFSRFDLRKIDCYDLCYICEMFPTVLGGFFSRSDRERVNPTNSSYFRFIEKSNRSRTDGETSDPASESYLR